MRTVGVVTVSRSDYSIYLPILKRLQKDPDIRLHLMVTGMHLSPEFGSTVEQIEKDGFEIGERVEMLLSSDSPEGIAKSMGLGIIGFSNAYSRTQPDILLLMGDRFEMHAAAAAALPFNIPVAHIHGGELTEGAIDDSMRHAITKMSHLHFVSTETYGRRVVQMGEEPWRVIVSGAPSLDTLINFTPLCPTELNDRLGVNLSKPTLLVTFHPVTRAYQDTEWHASELLSALDSSGMNVIFTFPNADTAGRSIIRLIEEFTSSHQTSKIAMNAGPSGYYSLMKHSAAMVGNSSSGIIEAASFGLPVVNIGDRQKGRITDLNVIDVGYHSHEVLAGIKKAVSQGFADSISGLVNSYGDGHAAESIVSTLKEIPLDDAMVMKRFHDIDY